MKEVRCYDYQGTEYRLYGLNIKKIVWFFLLGFSVLNFGCARYEWVNPHVRKGSEQFITDENLCDQKALETPTIKTDVDCVRRVEKKCVQFVPRTYTVKNTELFEACMQGKGYRRQRVEE
ncbi:MAG: hypothetical protein ACL93V_02535 [Candidatus Electrothrix sp. YB6]